MLELEDHSKTRMLSDDDVHAGIGATSLACGTLSADSVILAGRPHHVIVAQDWRHSPGSDGWVEQELTRLVDLDDNWDGYSAVAPTAEALRAAAHFLEMWRPQPCRPTVMGSTEAGVLLEWETDEVALILEFEEQGDVSAYVQMDQTEVEGPVPEHLEAVRDALERLAKVTGPVVCDAS